MPLVSIVVPSRGGADRLPVLLDALRAQEGPEWEAVVVIDGDVDDSGPLLRELAGDLPVRIVVFDQNQGRSAALNAGFAEARGQVLVRCDDDLVPSPDYVSRHAAAHDGQPVGVVGLYRNVYPETAYARVYGRHWDEQFRREAYSRPPDQWWRCWAGNVSVTRETWERIGPYDMGFRAYGWEDVDWGYRLSLAGIPVLLDPGLETEHRIAATTTASRAQRAFYSGAAQLKFDAKHGITNPRHSPSGPWQRGVSTVAASLDEDRATRLGRLVDHLADVLPERVARKAVALTVESSAIAGRVRGDAGGAI